MSNDKRCLVLVASLTAFAGCEPPGAGDAVPGFTPPVSPAGGMAAPAPATAAECIAGARLIADTAVPVGKTAGLVLAGCPGPLTDLRWYQTEGPAVELLATRSQAIGFEPPEPGRYLFQVDYRDAGGVAGSRTASVTATPAATGSYVTVRTDQAVPALYNTSVRAWPTLAMGDRMAAVTWEQLAGPPVMLDDGDQKRIVFTAPRVQEDTVLIFRATLRTTAGALDSDNVAVLVESWVQPSATSPARRRPLPRLYPYRATGRYADHLLPCVWFEDLAVTRLCPLQRLPLLGQEVPPGEIPTVDQIMDRVLVSHDWVGANFERFLRTHDPDGDLRRMFAAVTAVTIGTRSVTSFYNPTSTVNLDANLVWLTPAERDLIDEAPVYRTTLQDQQDGLKFRALSRWTKDGAPPWRNYPRQTRLMRAEEDFAGPLTELLFHELAHALDQFPVSVHGSLDSSKSPYEVRQARLQARQLVSNLLDDTFPLASQEMRALGKVMYHGVQATDAQKNYEPATIAEFVRSDVANDSYNYANPAEDLAMVIHEFLMVHRRGVRRDFAITSVGMATAPNVVFWGQRGRIGDPALRPRLRLAREHILPWIAPESVDSLPAPISMPPGITWGMQLPAASAGQGGR